MDSRRPQGMEPKEKPEEPRKSKRSSSSSKTAPKGSKRTPKQSKKKQKSDERLISMTEPADAAASSSEKKLKGVAAGSPAKAKKKPSSSKTKKKRTQRADQINIISTRQPPSTVHERNQDSHRREQSNERASGFAQEWPGAVGPSPPSSWVGSTGQSSQHAPGVAHPIPAFDGSESNNGNPWFEDEPGAYDVNDANDDPDVEEPNGEALLGQPDQGNNDQRRIPGAAQAPTGDREYTVVATLVEDEDSEARRRRNRAEDEQDRFIVAQSVPLEVYDKRRSRRVWVAVGIISAVIVLSVTLGFVFAGGNGDSGGAGQQNLLAGGETPTVAPSTSAPSTQPTSRPTANPTKAPQQSPPTPTIAPQTEAPTTRAPTTEQPTTCCVDLETFQGESIHDNEELSLYIIQWGLKSTECMDGLNPFPVPRIECQGPGGAFLAVLGRTEDVNCYRVTRNSVLCSPRLSDDIANHNSQIIIGCAGPIVNDMQVAITISEGAGNNCGVQVSDSPDYFVAELSTGAAMGRYCFPMGWGDQSFIFIQRGMEACTTCAEGGQLVTLENRAGLFKDSCSSLGTCEGFERCSPFTPVSQTFLQNSNDDLSCFVYRSFDTEKFFYDIDMLWTAAANEFVMDNYANRIHAELGGSH